MILECPACHTRYTVPDGAIGPNGRSVRCKNCGHSWREEPPELPELVELAKAEPPIEPPQAEADIPAAEAEQQFHAAEPEPVYPDEPNEPAQPRRWGLIVAIIGLILLAVIGAALAIGTDRLKTQLGLAGARASVSLLLEVPRSPERRQLASGNELFALTGRVVNPTRERQNVPDIQAELQDAQGRVVYSWVITPPTRTLAPGASADFNAAEVDVPKGAQELKLSFVGGLR